MEIQKINCHPVNINNFRPTPKNIEVVNEFDIVDFTESHKAEYEAYQRALSSIKRASEVHPCMTHNIQDETDLLYTKIQNQLNVPKNV